METGRVVQEICAWRQTRPDAGRVKPGNNLQHRSSEYWLLNLASVLAVGESWYTYDVMHIALSNLNQNGWLLGSDLDYYCLIVLLCCCIRTVSGWISSSFNLSEKHRIRSKSFDNADKTAGHKSMHLQLSWNKKGKTKQLTGIIHQELWFYHIQFKLLHMIIIDTMLKENLRCVVISTCIMGFLKLVRDVKSIVSHL